MKHKRELTIRVDDSLKVSFVEATSETDKQGISRKESERIPMDAFGTPGALAQAVGMRIGGFLGESARDFSNLFEETAESERKAVVAEKAAAPSTDVDLDEPYGHLVLLAACRSWRRARQAMAEQSLKPIDVGTVTAIEQQIAQAVKEIDEALDGIK